MTVIALVDTEMAENPNGLLDCMVALPEGVRAPALKDFVVRTSGLGQAEVIGVTPLAGQRRNSWRLTIRHAADAGLLSVRYRPELAATHGNKQIGGLDVSVMGSSCRSTLDESGEWHVPLSQASMMRSPGQPRRTQTPPAQQPGSDTDAGEPSADAAAPRPTVLPEAGRVLPLARPVKAAPAPEHAPDPTTPDLPAAASVPSVAGVPDCEPATLPAVTATVRPRPRK